MAVMLCLCLHLHNCSYRYEMLGNPGDAGRLITCLGKLYTQALHRFNVSPSKLPRSAPNSAFTPIIPRNLRHTVCLGHTAYRIIVRLGHRILCLTGTSALLDRDCPFHAVIIIPNLLGVSSESPWRACRRCALRC
jgi:hypothetical protein